MKSGPVFGQQAGWLRLRNPTARQGGVTSNRLIHQLFLCTVAQELWNGFSSQSKKFLGIPGNIKADLALDEA